MEFELRTPVPSGSALADGESRRRPGALGRADVVLPILAGGASLGLAVVAPLVLHGAGEEGLLRCVRWTARLAFPIFALAYVASPLARLWPGPGMRGLLRQRRAIGLAYGVAQGVHLLAIGAFLIGTEERRSFDLETAVGGLGMLWAAAMAATSTDAAQRRLGRSWSWLHRIGLHLLWGIYAVTYLGRYQADAAYAPGLVMVIAIGVLRAGAWARRRTTRPSATPSLGSPGAPTAGDHAIRRRPAGPPPARRPPRTGRRWPSGRVP